MSQKPTRDSSRKTRTNSTGIPEDAAEKAKEGKKSDVGTGMSQSTITEMFQAEKEKAGNFETMFKSLEAKISKVATQDYIENQFKKMVSEEFLSKKLEALTSNLRSHIKEELKTVYMKIGQLEKQAIQSEEGAAKLQDSVVAMEIELANSKKENEKLKESFKTLEDSMKSSASVNKVYEVAINDLEQYTRRNSVRIYGIDDRDRNESASETSAKVINILRNKLNLKLGEEDIDIAHRLGPFRADGNRPIICKFISRMHKYEVIRARRKLKGSGIVIREDLTIKNAKLLEKTSENSNVKSVWSDDGKIIALLKSDKKVVINLKTDLTKPIG